MRLKDDVNASICVLAGCCQRGTNFCRVVAVVVDHGYAPCFSANLKAAIDSTETGDACSDLLGSRSKLMRDSHCGRGIKRVVAPGNVQLKWAELAIRRVNLE